MDQPDSGFDGEPCAAVKAFCFNPVVHKNCPKTCGQCGGGRAACVDAADSGLDGESCASARARDDGDRAVACVTS